MTSENSNFTVDFDKDCIHVKEPQMKNPNDTDALTAQGKLLIELIGPDGEVKYSEEIKNLIVNTGLYWFAKKLAGESTNEMSHIAVGTSSTSASASQTTLVGSELGRVAMDSKIRTTNQVVMVATFGAGVATGTLNEAAIFDGSSGTTMLSRVVFSGAVNKGASDSFQVTWTITFNAA